MPGKKDRKRERGGGGGGGLSALLGVPQMPTGADEDDLEAELLALTGGKSTKKGGKKPKGGDSGHMSLADIDKMVASVKDIGDGDEEDADMSDLDDDDLLSELRELQEGSDDDDDIEEEIKEELPVVNLPPVATRPVKPVSAPEPTPSEDFQTVQTRLQVYQSAIAAAKSKGESSKVRRYERGLKTLQEMSKSLKSGRKVNIDEIPPEISVPAGAAGGGGGGVGVGGASTKVGGTGTSTSRNQKDDDDDLAELQSWVSSSSSQQASFQSPPSVTPHSAPPTKPTVDVRAIQERLQLYQEALKTAESQGDSSKARRYKRSIGNMDDMLKTARAGRPVNMEDLPPIISTGQSVAPPTKEPPRQPPPPQVKPKPAQQTGQTRPGNLIDLDAPEFDEFNLSEEDMEAMLGSFVDDRSSASAQTKATPTSQPLVPSGPPQPKPKPKAPSSSSRPPGLIDLDTPEFAEFDLSDADLEMMANSFVDDRKKDTPPAIQAPVPTPRDKATQSLPSRPPAQREQGGRAVTKELVLSVLSERRTQYMNASQKARSHGDEKARKQYGLVAVNFKRAIEMLEAGKPVDLKGIPPPPPGFTSTYNVDISSYAAPGPTHTTTSPQSSVTSQKPAEEEESGVDPAIPTPKTPLEALQQRLDKYKEGLKSAQEKGESSRVRRTSRIIKQYEEAIKMTRAGKPYDYSELPTPPGFPPIPTGSSRPLPAATGGAVGGRPQPRPTPSQSLPVSSAPVRLIQSVSDKQLQTIQERGEEFLRFVKQAKAQGDKDKALTYLRYYKAIQQMLQAAQGGLPVDLTQLPPSPFADPSKAKPTASILSHLGPAKEGDDKTFDLIEDQLQQQMEVCRSNGELYQKLGNMSASAQYTNMADQCQRDLLAIKGIRSQKLTPPKFTMEMREFSIVHSHPDISDKQVEVDVVRGITLPAPSGYSEGDMNVYVDVEFPWPQDSPQKFQTDSVKETSNPQFKGKNLFEINRKQTRSLSKVFKRHPVKCTIYQHRTLRKDIFIGLVLVSLESLETKCELHVTEDLKDEKGRRPVGGKLEVKVRLREPLSGRDQEVKKQKWLVFQEAIATEPSVKMLKPATGGAAGPGGVVSPIKIEQTTSLEALKLELSIVQNALRAGKKDPATVQRGQAIQGRMKLVKQKLLDPGYRREYVMTIGREMKQEKALEQQLIQAGRTGEAKVIQGRRKMMENELSKFQK